jgi:hypothetical protein
MSALFLQPITHRITNGAAIILQPTHSVSITIIQRRSHGGRIFCFLIGSE